MTGAPTVNGTSNVNNAAAQQAKADLRTAYLDAEGRAGPILVAAGGLGGRTLAHGLYKDDGAPASLGIATGQTLTLQGDASSVWIFQSASTLIAETGSRVVLSGGAQACNVFWQVGSSATLRTGSSFVGTVMAHTSISVENSVPVAGRLLAGAQANGAGALTMDTDTITRSLCAAPPTTTAAPTTTIAHPCFFRRSHSWRCRPRRHRLRRLSLPGWRPHRSSRCSGAGRRRCRSRTAAPARRVWVERLRPITEGRTVLPVIGRRTDKGGTRWLRVRLPGCPNNSTGWIRKARTTHAQTAWHLVVDLSERRVTVYRRGRVVRSFSGIVGAPATPTPKGTFFVEETVALRAADVGAPYALALSARSYVLQEFAGGPGQIALHGLRNVGGMLGTAVSHGCIRLDTAAITWLGERIGPGVPVTIAS